MKTAEHKISTTRVAKNTSLFSKGSDHRFFGPARTEAPFFPQRNVTPVQPKLTIGQPNDKYEQEADAMADKVVQRLSENQPRVADKGENAIQTKAFIPATSITSLLQAKCASCEKEEGIQKKEEVGEADLPDVQFKKQWVVGSNPDETDDEKNIRLKCAECEKGDQQHLQAKAEHDSFQAVLPGIEKKLNSSKGSGSPLPAATRVQMESSFGVDFSGVRIHNDSNAWQMNKDLHAQAFAHGNDIYFNAGKYNPESTTGKHLLAHELTHTVQQKAASGRSQRKIQRWPGWVSDAAGWVSDTAADVAGNVAEGAAYVGGQVADGARWVGGKIASGAEWVGDQVSAAAQWLIGQIRGVIGSGMNYLNGKWESIKQFGRSCFDDLKNGFGDLVHLVTTPLSALMSALSGMNADLLGSVWGMLKSGANTLWGGINSVIQGVLQLGQGIWNTVSEFVNGIFDTVTRLFDNSAFDLLPDWIKAEARSLLTGLRSLWNQVSSFWTDLWGRLNSSVQEILTGVRSFVDNVIGFSIDTVITMVRGLKEVYDYVLKFFANPRATIQPLLDTLATKLDTEAPPRARTLGHQLALANSPGSAPPAAASANIQRKESDNEERRTATIDEVGKGILYHVGKFWDQLNIKEMLWQTVVNTFWPPATIEAIFKEFSELWNDHWATTVNSLYAPHNFFDKPWVCLQDVWSNFLILLDFPLSLWRTLNHVAGLLIGYVTIIVVLVEAILGGVAAVEVGVVPGLLAGAAAGLATMAPIGEALMASYLLAESATVIILLTRLFTARQTCEKRQVDISVSVSSFISMAVALTLQVLMALLAELVNLVAGALKGTAQPAAQPAARPQTAAPPAEAAPPRVRVAPDAAPTGPRVAPDSAPIGPRVAPDSPFPAEPFVPEPEPVPLRRLPPVKPPGQASGQAGSPAQLSIAAKFESSANDFPNPLLLLGNKQSMDKLPTANNPVEEAAADQQMTGLSLVPSSEQSPLQLKVQDQIDPDACKVEKCPAPKTSAPGIGNIQTHGRKPPGNRNGPLIHHTQSEHIIPFATARSLLLAVGITTRARDALSRFDKGMITIIIYRGAADGKNKQDNVYSKQFEDEMVSSRIPQKTEQARLLYQNGDKAGGEALGREVVSSVTSALDTLRASAVDRTEIEVEAEWVAVEKGCTETNGQRRSENQPKPGRTNIADAANQQLNSIIELAAEALVER